MATPEALTKYYDCLKDSFNKIQVKDNKTALVNAALRPKIKEEFEKSRDLLISYLNYLQVFTLIYSDKFTPICISIICPLFKDHIFNETRSTDTPVQTNDEKKKDTSQLVHDTIRVIFKSKPELIDEFIQSIIKLFPNANSDDEKVFIAYFSNALQICTYVRGEPLTNLVARMLDRVNPPEPQKPIETDKKLKIKGTINASYELIYEKIDLLEGNQLENVSGAILAAFTREFITSENEATMNYLILYICSKSSKLADLFTNLLWANFTDPDRSFDERRASVLYISSFMSRAKYIDLDKVLNHLETASIWCKSFIDMNSTCGKQEGNSDTPAQSSELYQPLVESMLYLITQRYREMYEEESLARLKKLDLDTIVNSQLKPLISCNQQTVARFSEVSALYRICSLPDNFEPKIKRRKSTNEPTNRLNEWKLPFKEHCDSLPARIENMYHNYYNHRNFTIYRD